MKFLNGKLLAFVVIAAGILGSAFAINKNVEKKHPTFFYYFLKVNGDPTEPSDYTVRESMPQSSCGGESNVCWIIAEDNGTGLPILTDPLKEEIEDALEFGQDTENVSLRD